jgi:hypothetical protein
VPTASLMFKVARRAPVAAGLNVKAGWDCTIAVRLDLQVDVSLKSPASVPPRVLPLIAIDAR